MGSKPRIYVTRLLPESVLDRLRAVAEVTCFPREDRPVPPPQLLASVTGVHGILSMLTDRITETVMEAAGPNLRVIANMAVGYDNIDVAAATGRGIAVTNTPDVLSATTADFTFALMLATARRMVEAERYLRAGKWSAWAPLLLAGVDVHGATLGIVGMGKIGTEVAKRAVGFGMQVLYHNRSRNADVERRYGCTWLPLDTLLQLADFVVVLTPLTPETRGLIGERELRLMKPTAILINTARGPVVDERALVQALKDRRIRAAGLDVYEVEPIQPENPLLALDNAVLMPHIGSASIATRLKMAHMAVDNILAVLQGETPPNLVNMD